MYEQLPVHGSGGMLAACRDSNGCARPCMAAARTIAGRREYMAVELAGENVRAKIVHHHYVF